MIKHPDEIDKYCKQGLRADQYLIKNINNNQTTRAEIKTQEYMNWENSLKENAQNRLNEQNVGVDEKLPTTTNMRQMLKDLGLEEIYGIYIISSDSIHGGWANLSYEFLTKKDGRYYPDLEDHEEDIRAIGDVLYLCLRTLKCFINTYPGHGISGMMSSEIEKDMNRTVSFTTVHQNYVKDYPLNSEVW